MSRDGVNRDDMSGFVVPWAVFPPVGSGNLLPGVVESAIVGEDLHGGHARELMNFSDPDPVVTWWCGVCDTMQK